MEGLPAKVDWKSVIGLAAAQGVDVIAADGVQKLVDEGVEWSALDDLSAQDEMAMNWLGQGFVYEIRDTAYRKAVEKMVGAFAADGLQTVILKGCSLSRYWPVPYHRPLGDIDFYVFRGEVAENAAAQADAVLSRGLGLAPATPGEKHSVSHMGDMLLENHSTFLNEGRDRTGKCLNRAIYEAVADVAALGTDPLGFRTLPPTANCLFLLRHMTKHFLVYESVTLRQVLDLALFLNAERGAVDLKELRLTLRAVKMDRIADVFFSIAETVSGFSFREFFCSRRPVPQRTVARVMDDVLKPKEALPRCGVRRVLRRARNFLSCLWKYSLVPDSVVCHMLHPSILDE